MRGAAHRLIDKHRPVVMLLDSHEFDSPLCSKSGEQRRLASRPRAHVEPCLLRVIDQRARKRKRHELTALVLHSDKTRLDDIERLRGAIDEHGTEGRPSGGVHLRQGPQLLGADSTGSGHEGRSGRLVVGFEQKLDLIAPIAECILECPNDPGRMRQSGGQTRHIVTGDLEVLNPLLRAARRHLAQDRVDEPGAAGRRAGIAIPAGQLTRGVDGSMARHAHRQELMAAESQHVLQPGLDARPASSNAGLEDGVVPALPAKGSVA